MALKLRADGSLDPESVISALMLFCGSTIGEHAAQQPLLNVAIEMNTEEIPTLPGARASLDLTAVNNGQIDAITYVEVTVPTVQADKIKLEDDVVPREGGFIPVVQYEPNQEWTLLSKSMEDCILSEVYGYKSVSSHGR